VDAALGLFYVEGEDFFGVGFTPTTTTPPFLPVTSLMRGSSGIGSRGVGLLVLSGDFVMFYLTHELLVPESGYSRLERSDSSAMRAARAPSAVASARLRGRRA